MFKYTQRTFTGGVLDKELMGRQDLQKYFSGASLLKNFLVRRQGNLAKRRGTDLAATVTNILGYTVDAGTGAETDQAIGKTRLIPIVHDRDVGYYALITGRRAFIVDGSRGVYCTDGAFRRSVARYEYKGANQFPRNAECVLDGVYYETLKDAVRKSYPNCRIDLRRDVDLNSSPPVCRGVINLNGHTLTVKGDDVGLTFANEAEEDDDCGLVDLTFPRSGFNVVWDGNVSTDTNTAFITHAVGGFLNIRGIRANCPVVGSGACFVRDTANLRSGSSITDCNITCGGGGGFLKVEGERADESAGNVSISECDIVYTHATGKAVNNTVANASRRSVWFDSSTLTAAKYASTCGLEVNGGIVRHASGCLGSYSGTDAGVLSLVHAGLILNGTSTTETSKNVMAGSVRHRETEEGGTTYGNYNEADEGAYAYSRNPEPTAEPIAYPDIGGNATPYSIAVPYEDGDLDAIDVFQSGDTVFLAHKNYPPSRLAFSRSSMSLAFENIVFKSGEWLRPAITGVTNKINVAKCEVSCQSSYNYKSTVSYADAGDHVRCTKSVYAVNAQGETELRASATQQLPKRTVSYVVTYVKDGVESAPSNPVEVTYGAPWENGGVVKLTLGKGGNDAKPDYYNIYKKESTEYGLIGTTRRALSSDLFPELKGWFDSPHGSEADDYFDVASADTATFCGRSLQGTNKLDVVNSAVASVLTEAASKVVGTLGEYSVWRGVGGLDFGDRGQAVFEFGANSAVGVNAVDVYFDTHTVRYVENAATGRVRVYDDMKLGGKKVYATAYYTNKDGGGTVQSQALGAVTLSNVTWTDDAGASHAAYSGKASRYCGEIDPGADFSSVSALFGSNVRKATFAFTDLDGGDKQIEKVVFRCTDDVDDGSGATTEAVVDACLCGIVFRDCEASGSVFEDDYITPDLTVTPPSDEAVFRGRGNYPSCVGLYQQRLIFAATADQPFGFWMSAVGDLYNFTPHSSIREDDAIEAELAATEFPNINHVVMNRDIIMLGDGGEWKVAPVSGNTITYKTVSAMLQSSIGSAKWLKPLTVGKEIIFAERTGMTLRSIVYNFSSDGYESTDLSVLSSNLFADNRIERMCYKQHPDSTIACVLADGTVAVLVYMPEHEVAAWSQCVLGGGYGAKDVATSKALNGNTTDVLLTVRKGAETELWAVRPDLPEKTVDAQTCMDRVQRLTAAEAASGWVAGWTAVDRATGASVTSAAGLVAGHEYLCGFVFDAEVATVRPEPSGEGTIQFEIKNAKDVEVRCLDGASWKVAPYGLVDHPTYAQKHTFNPTAVDGALTLDGADVRLVLTGKNGGDGRVHLKCTTPYPQSILSVSVDYEIQPMSNQEG